MSKNKPEDKEKVVENATQSNELANLSEATSTQPEKKPLYSKVSNAPSGVGQASNIITPYKMLPSMYLTRLGIIFSNLSIICVVYCLGSVLTTILSALAIMLGFMLMIVSVGLIFIFIPNYWQLLMHNTDVIGVVNEFLIKTWPIVAIVGVCSAVASILCLCFDKTRNHIPRIVISSVMLGIIIVFALAIGLGG